MEFHWINVTEDFAPDNQYYHSTTTRGESGDIEKVSLVYTDENGGYKFVDVPPHKIPTGTYELIGPKVQVCTKLFTPEFAREIHTGFLRTLKFLRS